MPPLPGRRGPPPKTVSPAPSTPPTSPKPTAVIASTSNNPKSSPTPSTRWSTPPTARDRPQPQQADPVADGLASADVEGLTLVEEWLSRPLTTALEDRGADAAAHADAIKATQRNGGPIHRHAKFT